MGFSAFRQVTKSSADYPKAWLSLPGGPGAFFLAGKALETCPRVGIVGARAAPPRIRHRVEEEARRLTARGFQVVSGAAVGVDASAHVGALPQGSVAVVPFGIETGRIGQAQMPIEQILGRGGSVLCLSLSRSRARARYVARNRLLAALCERLIIAWAAPRGGTMHTVRFAQAMGIPLEAWWHPDDGPSNDGCRRLQARGLEDEHPLLRDLRNTGGLLTDDLRMAWGPTLAVELVELELSGCVVRAGPSVYRVCG